MNCLDFRRQLLTDPLCRDEDFLHHAAACPGCGSEMRRAFAFEEKLRQAMSLEPPPELESRILLAQQLERPHRSRRPGLALAAGLALALGLGGWLGRGWLGGPGGAPLAAAVLEHIELEVSHLAEDRRVSADALALLLAPFGASLAADGLGDVRYAGRCRIRRGDGVHLVLGGERGPVTVLLMPGEEIARPLPVSGAGFEGLILPTGYGSMAVVGSHREPVGVTAARVQQALTWRG